MKSNYKKSNQHTEGDQHRLVGQILDDRLRVISLNNVSPRQWLYQVEPPSVGKTRRALKVLGDPLAREPGSFYRLKTAYDRLKKMNSPYVEHAYECGLLHDLTPYILVEWEPHSSLYEYLRLKRKPLTWFEAKKLLINLARGLADMHKKGIAHGDLRPQHILLRHPPHTPVIIDACINSAFGSLPVAGLDRSSAFWAPERWSLSSATPPSDMYSFGAIIYYCLHGHPPFNLDASGFNEQGAELPLKSPLRCLEEAHLEREPLECDASIPSHIRELVKALLVKSPRQRPTINEVLDVLEADQIDDAMATTVGFEAIKIDAEPNQVSEPKEASDQPSVQVSASENAHSEKVQDLASSQAVVIDLKADDKQQTQEAQMTYPSPLIISLLCSIGAILGLLLAKL